MMMRRFRFYWKRNIREILNLIWILILLFRIRENYGM